MQHQCDFIPYHCQHIEMHWRDSQQLHEFMDICETGLPTIELMKAREDNLRDQIFFQFPFRLATAYSVHIFFPYAGSFLVDKALGQ